MVERCAITTSFARPRTFNRWFEAMHEWIAFQVCMFHVPLIWVPSYNTAAQGSKGIRQWLINWRTSSALIHKVTLSVNYNYWLKRLDTQLNEPANQNLIKASKVVNQTNKKTLL